MEIKEIILWLFLSFSLILNIIYLISTYKENYKKTFEDPLTKLRNRKFLAEIEKMVKVGKDKYEVVFCDIDHFKRVNDTYGHDVGDRVLEIVGKKLKSSFKDSKDYIVRYGGEEFIIFIRNDISEINSFKETIYKRVDNLRKDIEAQELSIEDNEIKFTMSFGICHSDKGFSFDEQIKKADESLYYSKEHGRNKITIFGDNDLNK